MFRIVANLILVYSKFLQHHFRRYGRNFMQTIYDQGNFVISSNFGASVVEGTEPFGSLGQTIKFNIHQKNPIYNYFWISLEPLVGNHADFWGAYPYYTDRSGDVAFKINPDNLPETNETFRLSFYGSAYPSADTPLVASVIFEIIDDDTPIVKFGDAGNNIIVGGILSDNLFGGAGNDTLIGGAGNDGLSGEDGDDRINAGDGNDLVLGGAGNDELGGDLGNDTIVGDAGNDTLFGEFGDDRMNGGADNDILIGGAGNDELGGGSGDDILIGEGDNDTLFGEDGNDRLSGGFGADTLIGGLGNDELDGGAGNDRLNGGGDADMLLGNEGDDELGGGAGNDVLAGGDGADVLFGEDGNDTLDGGTGADILIGGAGADQYNFGGNSGYDMIVGFNAAEGDRLALYGLSYVLGQDQYGNALLALSGGGSVALSNIVPGQVNTGFFA